MLEARDKVGGIARTETLDNYYFDIGGHRFFTRNGRIDGLWRALMGEELLTVKRLSRIYYRKRFIQYPINVVDAMSALGIGESLRIGMEYFCTVRDELWRMSDKALVAPATSELSRIGLSKKATVVKNRVVREPFAYPVYGRDHPVHLHEIQQYIGRFDNLVTMGRNGVHRYHNMDHAMETGFCAARTVLGESGDVWSVNTGELCLETACRPSPGAHSPYRGIYRQG